MSTLSKCYENRWFIIKILKNPSQRKHLIKWIETIQEDQFLLQEIPWIAFDAIDHLNTLSLRSKRIFEWGSGGSTLFWLKKGAYVVSVEHNRQWYEKMKLIIKDMNRVDYKLIEPEIVCDMSPDLFDPSDPNSYLSSTSNKQDYYKYVSYIDQFENNCFDIILIDGRARPSCIKHAVNKIKTGGILILDNSDRDHYLSKTSHYLKNFQKNAYFGAVPLINMFNETAMYTKT